MLAQVETNYLGEVVSTWCASEIQSSRVLAGRVCTRNVVSGKGAPATTLAPPISSRTCRIPLDGIANSPSWYVGQITTKSLSAGPARTRRIGQFFFYSILRSSCGFIVPFFLQFLVPGSSWTRKKKGSKVSSIFLVISNRRVIFLSQCWIVSDFNRHLWI